MSLNISINFFPIYHSKMKEWLFLILGLGGLLLSSNILVHSLIYLSRYFKIPKFVASLFLLPIGADLPELSIAINTSLSKTITDQTKTGIVLGDSLGSYFSQGSLVLGVSSILIFPIISKRRGVMHGGSLLISALIFSLFWFGDQSISRFEGIVLILVYILYLIGTLYFDPGEKKDESREPIHKSLFEVTKKITFFVSGFVGIYLCSKIAVDNIVMIGDKFDLPQTMLSFFTIGVGSSLPELGIAINAAWKRESTISLGNIIGSNIFDILLVSGIAAVISPLSSGDSEINYYAISCVALSILLCFFLFRKKGLQKMEGIILLFFFILVALGRFLFF